MRAVALVAHPDDCAIFAWPFIEAHPEFTWEIVYLTYRTYEPRALEVATYWANRNIPTKFLGYVDNYQDMLDDQLSFSIPEALASIMNEVNADLVLTHFEDGDYGHIHHKFVNGAARQLDIPKVYFASTFNYNTEYTVSVPVNTEELPLHRDVIEQFADRNVGRYIVTPEAETLLKKNK